MNHVPQPTTRELAAMAETAHMNKKNLWLGIHIKAYQYGQSNNFVRLTTSCR